MGVPAHELAHDPIGHVVDRETGAAGALGRNPGVKYHLEEDVAEFVPQRLCVAGLQRLKRLVRLLDQVRRE